jgi:hypothetical protein
MQAPQYYTAAGLAAIVFRVACRGHAAIPARGSGTTRPVAGAFGFGPRVSAERRHIATLQPQQALRGRQLQSMCVAVDLPDPVSQTARNFIPA